MTVAPTITAPIPRAATPCGCYHVAKRGTYRTEGFDAASCCGSADESHVPPSLSTTDPANARGDQRTVTRRGGAGSGCAATVATVDSRSGSRWH
jgi:hypothetical protein